MDKLKQQKLTDFPTDFMSNRITDFDPGDVGRYVECESDRDLLDDEARYARLYE